MRRPKYPRGWMLPVTELIFTAWQLLAQRNQTEPQNKSCLKCPFSLKPDPDLSHHSQVFLNLRLESNQNIHWFATWTIISEASHNNSFIHSSINWLLKPSFEHDRCTFFLTFSLQVRHRDMTVLTSGKLSRYYKLENIRQKVGFSTSTMLVTPMKSQVQGQTYFGCFSGLLVPEGFTKTSVIII